MDQEIVDSWASFRAYYLAMGRVLPWVSRIVLASGKIEVICLHCGNPRGGGHSLGLWLGYKES